MQAQQQTHITLIRHAQSLLNIASHQFRQKNNIPYVWQELCKHKQFLLGVKFNLQFMDCDITEEGVSQCVKARGHMQDVRPDVILVSPLFRTLRTCSLVFQNHQHVPVVCQPLLAEAFRSTCDIADMTGPKMDKFPNYNFDAVLQQGDFWFIKNDSQQNQQKYMQLLGRHQGKSYNQKCHQILNFMAQNLAFQNPQNVRQRCYKIKQKIQKQYAGKYKHIAIVSHYNIINCLMAQKFDQKSEPIDCLRVGNCEIVQNILQEMLRHK